MSISETVINRRAVVLGLGAVIACSPQAPAQPSPASTGLAARLISAARRQVGVTLSYDPAYTRLSFPKGDVPRAIGVCTDVVIRAYRDAFGADLQALVNADMRKAFSAYPRRWGLSRPDSNIDHRRVPNLQTYLSRSGAKRDMSAPLDAWEPGDIFTCLVGGNLPHIGIVSDKRTSGGRPLVIHNIGAGTREEDALSAHRLTGRYRWKLSA
jgi:uncharacterized protein